ncbi:hypothetical protein TW95_gp1756 [Pandoravirus inopinatum]|uniref:Transmembrane protein n=1 Tax=Pandoravirus inopinatum TaxID=1605721 RepID=A0A0B5J942_9VIRU|nr:hypothetical protein TW95_gp1756 [Pandoravirus inopinatum]AJF98490.1 hypothetical protein [Pandoravirus inopinatum]
MAHPQWLPTGGTPCVRAGAIGVRRARAQRPPVRRADGQILLPLPHRTVPFFPLPLCFFFLFGSPLLLGAPFERLCARAKKNGLSIFVFFLGFYYHYLCCCFLYNQAALAGASFFVVSFFCGMFFCNFGRARQKGFFSRIFLVPPCLKKKKEARKRWHDAKATSLPKPMATTALPPSPFFAWVPLSSFFIGLLFVDVVRHVDQERGRPKGTAEEKREARAESREGVFSFLSLFCLCMEKHFGKRSGND